MFAFAGASTFPTIQADMKDRSKFNYSAVIAMGGKNKCLLIYYSNKNTKFTKFVFLSSVPDLLSDGICLLLLSWRPCYGQHCARHVRWLGENCCGDHALAPPRYGLPYHHKSSSTVL